jgi:hypothetical protein
MSATSGPLPQEPNFSEDKPVELAAKEQPSAPAEAAPVELPATESAPTDSVPTAAPIPATKENLAEGRAAQADKVER